ncbi:MAG TPA: hypothetical protein PKC43_00850 [Phycisphaerales bacterium]|nr:hypothetical protein [Phycisphaerales bacterium]HMP35974.1 hypothetical protein [Phycisphaerales bacterium]
MTEGGAHLAIEASQRAGSVALRTPGGLVDEEPVTAPAEDLVAAIDRLAGRHGVRASQLAMIALSIGPGGFTGLRTAVAASKFIAVIAGAELVPVPSALVVAETLGRALDGLPEVLVLLASRQPTEARPGSAWASRLARDPGDGAWSVVEEGVRQDDDLSALLAAAPELTVVGEADHLPALAALAAPVRSEEPQPGAPRHRWIEPSWSASACLVAGERLHARGIRCAPGALLPLYARQPEAVTLWEARERARGSHPPR